MDCCASLSPDYKYILINMFTNLQKLHSNFIDTSRRISGFKQYQIEEHHCVALVIPRDKFHMLDK